VRHDIELFVDVEQLVAQRRENDAADEGARERGIEYVRILGETEAQGLRAGGCGERSEQQQGEAGHPGTGAHDHLR
jgi:hypothetical protein